MIKNSYILKINSKNLIKNYFFFKRRRKNLIVAPTIKANAYGLGSKKIFNILKKKGCKHFFVATLEEGIILNNINNKIHIYVLNGIQDNNINLFKKNNLIPIINTISEFKIIKDKNIKFGLHLDTGINRLGISHNEIPKIIYKNLNISLVISHLASADEINNTYNLTQRNRFKNIICNFENKKIIYSIANSNGSILSKEYLFDMIRPGIGLYGGDNKNNFLKKNIKPVVNLSGKIIQIKNVKKGEPIGYNQTYISKREIKIAIIGVGYADGIPRKLSNKGVVYYKDNKFKIIGRISMDSFTIDITKSKKTLKVGTYIDFINKKYGIESFANQCNTLSNEIITSIGSRAKKIYV